ncbi:hypothetical protein NPJ82_17600 (plasmid) [Sphingomonas sp. NY01]|uniref:hypothetical protein n=1 Tax=Sphingomonas TaxID=13687 RepID=UPI001374F859|nr:hypothetical protein [Sphingomonas carotinifaciens]
MLILLLAVAWIVVSVTAGLVLARAIGAMEAKPVVPAEPAPAPQADLAHQN